MTLERLPISGSAQVLARGGVLPCVSQVTIFKGRPVTPPLALIWATRILAAASAGVSNGFMFPVLSKAQPIVIGFALREALTLAATARLASIASATASTATLLVLVMHPPWFVGSWLRGLGDY